jgi:hypothetical protein
MTLTPYIPADAEATLTARASAVATKISEGLRYATLEEAIAEIRTSKVTPINLVDHFIGLLKKAAAGALVDAGNSTATEAIAMGRQHEAEIYRDDVKVVEYSALLDDATCDACRKADGKQLKMGSAEYGKLQPPNRDCRGRGRCRCVYVYILDDEGPAGVAPPKPKGPTLVPPPTQPPLIPPPAHVPMLPPPKLVPISASPIPLAPKLPVKVTPKAMPPIAIAPKPAAPKPALPVSSGFFPMPKAAPAPTTKGPTILPHYRADVAKKSKAFISAGQTETELENSFIRGELKKKIAADVGIRAAGNTTLLQRAGDARAAIFEADTGRKLTPLEKSRLSGADQVRGDIEQRTADMNRVWAQTSVDSHMRAIAAQIAAAEEFKLGAAAMTKLKAQVTRQGSQGKQAWKDAEEILAKPGEKEMMKVTLRAMHENTQIAFKQQGITHVAVARGMAVNLADLPANVRDALGHIDPNTELWIRNRPTVIGRAPSAEAKVALQPMSSTAASVEIADRFAGYADQVGTGTVAIIIKGTIPVELIVGTARTGMGCLHEYELVTLSGEGKWTIELEDPQGGGVMLPAKLKPKP